MRVLVIVYCMYVLRQCVCSMAPLTDVQREIEVRVSADDKFSGDAFHAKFRLDRS